MSHHSGETSSIRSTGYNDSKRRKRTDPHFSISSRARPISPSSDHRYPLKRFHAEMEGNRRNSSYDKSNQQKNDFLNPNDTYSITEKLPNHLSKLDACINEMIKTEIEKMFHEKSQQKTHWQKYIEAKLESLEKKFSKVKISNDNKPATDDHRVNKEFSIKDLDQRIKEVEASCIVLFNKADKSGESIAKVEKELTEKFSSLKNQLQEEMKEADILMASQKEKIAMLEKEIAELFPKLEQVENVKENPSNNEIKEAKDKEIEITNELQNTKTAQYDDLLNAFAETLPAANMELIKNLLQSSLNSHNQSNEIKEEETEIINEKPWSIVSKDICEQIYQKSNGQLTPFLSEYLPHLFNLSEQIAPLQTTNEKFKDAQDVIKHFWKEKLDPDYCSKEIENVHSTQKYKLTRKIFAALKNCPGCIMLKNQSIYECILDSTGKKFTPKNREATNKELFGWCIPNSLEDDEYIIVADKINGKRPTIYKIDLKASKKEELYTKRKYAKDE